MRKCVFGVVTLMGAGVFVGVATGDPPQTPDLATRAARIAHLLPGWAVQNTKLSSAPCRLAPASEEAARIAPTYTYPRVRPQAEVDLTITRFRTAAEARTVNLLFGQLADETCIRIQQIKRYQRLNHILIRPTFTRLPGWVKGNPSLLLHGFTETITSAGTKPLIDVAVVFADRTDPRISWSIALLDYGQNSLKPLFVRLLNAAAG